jgi:hypothetical protein
MPAERIQGQTVSLSNGAKVSGKTVRRASIGLIGNLIGSLGSHKPNKKGTYGTAKMFGYEIPVRRTRGRNGPWIQVGFGRVNNATLGGRTHYITY